MPLVNYSSDSSADGDRKPKRRKTTTGLPPLPDNFRDLYATPVRASKEDDPSLHGGRQRVTPHIEGNWPTHVYTEWYPTISQRSTIQKLIGMYSAAKYEVHDFLFNDLGVPAPLHISLSCSLGLKEEQRNAFAEELRSSIEQTNLQSFEVDVSDVAWVSNFTQTRWFLVLRIQKGVQDDLRALLDASNQVATCFGQKQLYAKEPSARINDDNLESPADPSELNRLDLVIEDTTHENSAQVLKTFDSFHISIAWTLSKPSPLKIMGSDDLNLVERLLLDLKVPVNAAKAKIGNNILTFPLKPSSFQKPSKS